MVNESASTVKGEKVMHSFLMPFYLINELHSDRCRVWFGSGDFPACEEPGLVLAGYWESVALSSLFSSLYDNRCFMCKLGKDMGCMGIVKRLCSI